MKKRHIATGLLAGLAVGGVLGVLFAPKSGKQIRQDIKKAYKATSKDIAKRINTIENLTQSKYNTIVDGVINEYQKLDPITQEQIQSLRTTLKSKWSEIRGEKKDDTKSSK